MSSPTWVQTQLNSCVAGGGTSTTFSLLHAWSSGHGLAAAAFIEFGVGGLDISSITDNAGNTYMVLGRQVDPSAATNFLYLFGLPTVNGNPTTLTIHFTGATSGATNCCWGEECSGVGSIDNFALVLNSVATNTPTSGNVTTTAADLVLGFYSPDSGSNPTAGSGFTMRANGSVTGLWDETQVQSAAGTIAATFSQSPTPGTGVVGLIALSSQPTAPLSIGKVHTIFNSTEITLQIPGLSTSQAILTDGLPFGTVELSQASGTSITSVQVQQSNDGATWINQGSAVSVPAVQDLYTGTAPTKFVRFLVNGGDTTSVVNIMIELMGTRG